MRRLILGLLILSPITAEAQRRTPRDIEHHCQAYALIKSIDSRTGGAAQEILRTSLLQECFSQYQRTGRVPPLPTLEDARASLR